MPSRGSRANPVETKCTFSGCLKYIVACIGGIFIRSMLVTISSVTV